MSRRNGFYKSLGLTRAKFYDKLGGRAGGGTKPSLQERNPVAVKAEGAVPPLTSSPECDKIDLGEQTISVAALLGSRKTRAPHKAKTCDKTRRGEACGTCYEKAKGRID